MGDKVGEGKIPLLVTDYTTGVSVCMAASWFRRDNFTADLIINLIIFSPFLSRSCQTATSDQNPEEATGF